MDAGIDVKQAKQRPVIRDPAKVMSREPDAAAPLLRKMQEYHSWSGDMEKSDSFLMDNGLS